MQLRPNLVKNVIYLSNFVQLKITNYITAHVSDGIVLLRGEGEGRTHCREKKWSQFHAQDVRNKYSP